MRLISFSFFCVVCLACEFSTVAMAEEAEKDIYKGNTESRLDALSSIQPGLGVVMHEMGYRMTATYWAANGGNWGLAQYELKELLEAQEVAEVTRPKRAEMLKAFEKGNLVQLGESIDKKDLKGFNQRFSKAVNACNACHTALGYSFIKFRVPDQSKHGVLDYNLKTEPRYKEKAEPK